MSTREQLQAERADLVAKDEAATSWGAAVGARSERIKGIDSELRLLDASTMNAKTWTPEGYWEFVKGLAGEHEAQQMRDMMAERGLVLASAQADPDASEQRSHMHDIERCPEAVVPQERTAPASCPNCHDESDCANVDICNAVDEAYAVVATERGTTT